MRWIQKNDWHFFDGLYQLYHHAKLGKIVQRAPAVGAKMCFFCNARVGDIL